MNRQTMRERESMKDRDRRQTYYERVSDRQIEEERETGYKKDRRRGSMRVRQTDSGRDRQTGTNTGEGERVKGSSRG